MRNSYFIISFCFVFYSVQAQVISIDNSKEITSIGNCISYFEDQSSNLTIDKIASPEFANKFCKHNKKIFFHSPTTSAFWFKFTISNHSGVDLWLSLGVIPPEYIDLYAQNIDDHSVLKASTGGLRPKENVSYPGTFWLPLNTSQQKESVEYYLRVKSNPPAEIMLNVGSLGSLFDNIKLYNYLIAVFLVIMLIISLLIFIIWIGVRENIYLMYLFSLLISTILTPIINGYFLIPSFGSDKIVWWASGALSLMSIEMFAYAYFIMVYMKLRQNFRIGYYVVSLLLIVNVVLGAVSVFVPYATVLNVFEANACLLDLSCLASIYYIWLVKKMRLAMFYALGQSILFAFLIILVLAVNGLIPYTFYTRNALYFGVVCEAWFFLMAINDRVLVLRKKKHQTENALLEKTVENQHLLREYTQTLEQQVKERTDELSIANQNLNKTNREIEKQNKQLLKQSEALAELNATKDKIFSIITHDLRNPFFVISNLAEMSLSICDKENHPQLKEFSQSILTSSKSASSLLENLSEWAHSQSGYKTIQHARISIKRKVEQGISLVRQIAINKKINIVLFDTDDCVVWADKNMLNAVIRNLLTNAIKYSTEGSNIIVSWRVQMNFCEVSVQDEGVGISAIHKDNLFRVDKSHCTLGTANEKGTGLGLIICKELVELNSGSIWVESEEGKGSNFKFTLPIMSDDVVIVSD